MTIQELPEPLTPAECDLTDYKFMPLHVERLRRSKGWLIAKKRPELGFYMINLWSSSWHEVPAASLEDDDDMLCELALCDPKKWSKVKEVVMRGWVKCSDGRLYHEIVAEVALEAWDGKRKQRSRTHAATEARRQRREAEQHNDAEQCPQRDDVRNVDCNVERDDDVTFTKGREGKGIEGKESKSPSLRSDTDAPVLSLNSPKPKSSEPEGFTEFWKVFPRRTAKGQALKAYAAALRRAFPQEILAGAKRYAASRVGEDERFTKHPATWLNALCWTDEPSAAAAPVLPLSDEDPNRAHCRLFKEKRIWPGPWGAPPLMSDGTPNPDCTVPKAILVEYGFLPPPSPANAQQKANAA